MLPCAHFFCDAKTVISAKSPNGQSLNILIYFNVYHRFTMMLVSADARHPKLICLVSSSRKESTVPLPVLFLNSQLAILNIEDPGPEQLIASSDDTA